MIYLDNAAAQKPLSCAIYAMNSVLNEKWANPNSIHAAGHKAFTTLQEAREIVARWLYCTPEQVIFTSSATEAADLAMEVLNRECGTVIVPGTEHEAVYSRRVPNRPVLRNAPYYAGIARMLANNETGELYDLSEYREQFPAQLIFTDATAAVGHIPVDFMNLYVDFLCADGMKFGGVPGCGVLIARVPSMLPLEHRSTPHVALAAAFAAALESRCRDMAENMQRVTSMRKSMEEYLLAIPGAKLNITRKARLPGIINISFFGVEGAALAGLLSQRGVCVSTGAACTSGDLKPSRVLLASGFDEQRARSSIRISIGEENTDEEIEQAAHTIRACVDTLRAIS